MCKAQSEVKAKISGAMSTFCISKLTRGCIMWMVLADSCIVKAAWRKSWGDPHVMHPCQFKTFLASDPKNWSFRVKMKWWSPNLWVSTSNDHDINTTIKTRTRTKPTNHIRSTSRKLLGKYATTKKGCQKWSRPRHWDRDWIQAAFT